MSTQSRPGRKAADGNRGKREGNGRFAAKPAASAASASAAAAYPPLRKARFTMPEPDFARMRALKERLAGLDRPTRKNELLRAGLHALTLLSDESLLLAVEQLPPAKPPKSAKAASKPAATAKPRRASRVRSARKLA